MNDLEFSFEESPWEKYFSRLQEDEAVDASAMLTLLEGEDEESFEEAFRMMEESDHWLDISDLPRPAYTGENGSRLRYEADWVKKGARVEKLEETDPLRLYLEELAMIPVCGDVAVLAEKLSQANREGRAADSLRLKLVNLLLSRVVEEAGAHTGRGVLLLDLIQEGSIGLWKATDVFVGRGEDFELVCTSWWIRFYMAKAVLMQARASGVGQKMRTALEDYKAVDERLLSDLGRNPTLEEIAEELHMRVEEASAVRKMLEDARLLAQVKKVPEPEEEQEEEDQAVEDTALFQMRQRILDLLSGLEEKDQKLLTLRFGLEGGKPLTPEETGRKLGLTPDEVVAREGAALAKLRNK